MPTTRSRNCNCNPWSPERHARGKSTLFWMKLIDMGFEGLKRIVGQFCPDIQTDKIRQTLMWTATWPEEIQKIAAEFLVDPIT
ncbi:hypothetical protein Pelo_11342 [Pelomyxa schiedti]|nr:hypothetical protein Pelo_11342 [Pelomyxa schiedti]